jgi:hypothetical protein
LAPQRIAQVISKQVVNKLAVALAVSKPAVNTLVITQAVNKQVVDILAARRLAIGTERALALRTLALILIILK